MTYTYNKSLYEYIDNTVGQRTRPVVVVAPHGHPNDDSRTCNVAFHMAEDLDCYLVNNVGWERNKHVDINNNKANLNDIDHGTHQNIKPYWIDKIVQYKNECKKIWGYCYVFMIHGMSDTIKQQTKDANIDIILGYGAGSQTGLSIEIPKKDLMIYHLADLGLTVYGGKANGRFAGAGSKNLNQMFRAEANYIDPDTSSVQLEIVYSLRSSDKTAEACGKLLASGITNYLDSKIGVPMVPILEY